MPSITTKHGSYPRTLLVDNYDSYTFNILQLLISQCQAHKVDPSTHILVIRNDQHAWPTVRDRILPHIDSIVISPGPGTPERAEDFGVCTQLISDSRLPLLGVCLGHQGIAAAFGGHVRKSSVPVHGQTSTIEVVGENTGIFEHMPRRSSVVRYHSLTVDEAGFPHDELEVLARACGTVKAWVDGCVADVQTSEIMALRHRRRPLFGVQFHPESVCSEHGAQIIANFQAVAMNNCSVRHEGIPEHVRAMSLQAADAQAWRLSTGVYCKERRARWHLVEQTVELPTDCRFEALFARLYGDSRMPVWLDSADGGANGSSMSVMASAAGPGSATVRYNVETRAVEVLSFDAAGGKTILAAQVLPEARGQSFWTWMQRVVDCTSGVEGDLAGFVGGWVGYFGYEMKAECMGMEDSTGECADRADGSMPDAQLAFVDRCVVIDHGSRPPRARVLALVTNSGWRPEQSSDNEDDKRYGFLAWTENLGFKSHSSAAEWVDRTVGAIKQWPDHKGSLSEHPIAIADSSRELIDVHPALSRSEYLAAIDSAKELIRLGESYEVCLTNRFSVRMPRHAAVLTAQRMRALYLAMRRRNPAPYGALLWYDDLQTGVASCSPERFLRVTPDKTPAVSGDRRVEMRPIKGTCRRDPLADSAEDRRRAESLRSDAKERAENLMIVDLIRHDLGWIARGGTVAVPGLMEIESFATVHQMVSTVCAQLPSDGVGDVGALAHCFPPGSMTGAPKRRTTQIIDTLEGPRGVYSGCLGYFSASGRQSDWSVVIRTAVVDQAGARVSVGAGGALTILSDPKAEWAEVETKLHAALGGIEQYILECS